MSKELIEQLAKEHGILRTMPAHVEKLPDDHILKRTRRESIEQLEDFAKAYAQTHGQSNWISVKDRLPKEYETCGGRVAALDEDGFAVSAILAREKLYCSSGEVTHWMPLPAAPVS